MQSSGIHDACVLVALIGICGLPVVMRGVETNMTPRKQQAHGKYAHAGSRTRVTSMGGLYDGSEFLQELSA